VTGSSSSAHRIGEATAPIEAGEHVHQPQTSVYDATRPAVKEGRPGPDDAGAWRPAGRARGTTTSLGYPPPRRTSLRPRNYIGILPSVNLLCHRSARLAAAAAGLQIRGPARGATG